MRILWLCNAILPEIAKSENFPACHSGGWMEGLSQALLANDDISLMICCPEHSIKALIIGKTERLDYAIFPLKSNNSTCYSTATENYLAQIVEQFNPQIVHIFGTEYPHSLAMVKVCEKFGLVDKTIIQIQGLCTPIAKHYYAGLPNKAIYGFSFRDILKRDNVYLQMRKFIKRGVFETQALQRAKHIIGRTDWDRACTHQVNPQAKYHFCNEILRDAFYTDKKWSLTNCEQYSIFISQATYPIKGLHHMIEALEIILRFFPQTHLYVAGNNITDKSTFYKRLKRTYYGKYAEALIEKKQLSKHITFLGNLNAEEMHERYLKSHVFISPSSIENESNSLSEAKIIGVPSVASYVGGVTNRILHGVDGFFYQYDAAYMLAHYVCEIFKNDELAVSFSENAKKHAAKTHDRERNGACALETYKTIINNYR